jgi:hypothetical protein
VIILFSDQHNKKVMGFEGHPTVISKNLLRIGLLNSAGGPKGLQNTKQRYQLPIMEILQEIMEWLKRWLPGKTAKGQRTAEVLL